MNSLYTNEPDTFQVELLDPGGDMLDSVDGSGGTLEISWPGEEGAVYNGNFSVVVTLLEAGDQEPGFNPLGLRTRTDDSNDYSVDITYQRFFKKMVGGEGGDVRWKE